jgi:DNA-binding MarR family transcriptional regulator
MSDNTGMSFDAVVANPGRLQILTALAVEERQDFVQLRRVTHLTDGNLSAHARRLETAGMLQIEKQFRDGKPVTSFLLTSTGRAALESHVRRLLAAMSHRRLTPSAAPEPRSTAVIERRPPAPAAVSSHDDWVD